MIWFQSQRRNEEDSSSQGENMNDTLIRLIEPLHSLHSLDISYWNKVKCLIGNIILCIVFQLGFIILFSRLKYVGKGNENVEWNEWMTRRWDEWQTVVDCRWMIFVLFVLFLFHLLVSFSMMFLIYTKQSIISANSINSSEINCRHSYRWYIMDFFMDIIGMNGNTYEWVKEIVNFPSEFWTFLNVIVIRVCIRNQRLVFTSW